MVFKWHSPEMLENYGLSKNDKFLRRATGQFWPFGADSPNDTQFRPRRFWPESLGSRPLPVWAAALTQHFSKGSRGGTWHVARGTCQVAPRDRRHRRSVVPAHRLSRLPSGSAQLFRRYSRNPCLRWPLSRRDPAESSTHFCHQMSATPLSRGE